MDVASIQALYGITPTAATQVRPTSEQGFDSILTSAMTLLKDTNALQRAAEKEEIAFALGESENTHDLMIAEQKANIALQYTVAIRDKVLESYNTLMNMQI